VSRAEAEVFRDGFVRRESLIRLIADNVPGYIAYVSADDLVYRFVNRSFEVGFGRPRDAIEGHHIVDIIGEDNYRFALPFIDEVRAGRATHYENTFQLVDGPRWTRVNYVPDFGPDGQVVGIVVLSYDITEARLAEEALRKERDFAELLVDATHAIVVVVDRDHRIVRMNRFGADLLGWDPEDAIGADALLVFTEKARANAAEGLARAFAGAANQGRHSRVATRERGVRDVVWYYRPLTATGVVSDGLLAVGHDVTDARRAEAERFELEQRLLQSQKLEALGSLAGGVAHDMNNVLASVTGLASLLAEELPPDSPATELVSELLAASRRGADLTRNLLGFARKGRYRTEPTCVDALIRQTATVLERTTPKDVRVTATLGASPVAVEGDPSQLAQALLNLALNAVDAVGSAGCVELRSSVREVTAPSSRSALTAGRWVLVEVIDDGAGMDAATVRRATEPFFTTKPPGRGTGLGLSMVYGTVTAHGGVLDIHSQVGHGTTITMALPAAAGSVTVKKGEPSRSPGARAHTGTALLVDDEVAVRTSTARLLERIGYRVVQATNGREAIDRFAECPREFAVVVLDMIMPVMDGSTAFGHLRELAPAVPILLCTAHQDERLMKRLLANPHVALLAKPFDLRQLTDAIERARGR